MHTVKNKEMEFVIEISGDSGQMGGIGDKVVESTRAMLDRAKLTVIQIGEEFSEAMSQIPLQCEYVDIKFGIKFDAEAGVVVSRASTSASLEVTLRVKPAEPAPTSQPTP